MDLSCMGEFGLVVHPGRLPGCLIVSSIRRLVFCHLSSPPAAAWRQTEQAVKVLECRSPERPLVCTCLLAGWRQ